MISKELILEQFEQYKLDYIEFYNQKNYQDHATTKISFDNFCSILYFSPLATMTKRIFLITPSVFNSPNILSIDHPNDLITNLRHLGAVYLVEWQKILDPAVNLNNYATILANVLESISVKHNQAINLIGHCLGGNLTIATSILKPNLVSSLVLMSPPWDFAYLHKAHNIYLQLKLNEAIESLDQAPAIYFQLLFFLMQPESFEQKIDYYSKQTLNKASFFAIEHWQFSGHALPKALYNQLMEDFIKNNIMLKNQWIINNNIINPALISKPVSIIIGTKDKIVASSSSKTLCDIIPNSTLFEYNTGHIGYLVGSQKEHFMIDLNKWINKVGENERSLYYAC
jgi:polyhydroxyalkanoate synthase